MPDKDERTLEQTYRSAVSGLYARLRSNYDFVYQKFGDDGIRLITDMSREYGLSVAERARSRLKNNDLASVVDYMLRIFDTVDRALGLMRVAERSDSRVVIRADRCPFHFNTTALCLAHTTMEKTVVEELNPALAYRIGKSIPAGDAYCEHIIEIRSAEFNGRNEAKQRKTRD